MAINPQPPAALYLHSAFRSGSTWFWNRFRRSAGVLAFYEPFNEVLATLTPEEIARNVPERWSGRHPKLAAPYYAEYLPLLRPEGGVTLFQPQFSYLRYFDVAADEGQRRYIANLVETARRAGSLPVLGFCRSLVRLPWFLSYCPGTHVATWRNPWDQWMSYHQLAVSGESVYFEFRSFLIASIGRCHKDYADFFSDLHLHPILDYHNTADEDFLDPFFYASHVDLRFRIFLRLYMLDMLTALEHADLVVDLDRMSGQPLYRREITEQLRRLSGLPELSFDDCALPRHAACDEAAYLRGMEEALAFLDGYFSRHPPTPARSRAIADLKDRMRACLTDMAAGVASLYSADAGNSSPEVPDEADLDRFTLCHVLFAIRRMTSGDGDPAPALGYLRAVYGADYPMLRDGLARMADFVGWWDDPAHAKERSAANRLGRALAVESP
ncbi:hypothetical protein [Telmatospirillum sp.]|uniref:hypothetical protein n=1 Tax=Telmatospirillum sp. TaxID=2079197 RepID=UPI0028447DDA|nr:hypothetical protein [Telmatospirillum sp.]MDR3438896.1 hypothetical protein [Telmatospirillum sp.]